MTNVITIPAHALRVGDELPNGAKVVGVTTTGSGDVRYSTDTGHLGSVPYSRDVIVVRS